MGNPAGVQRDFAALERRRIEAGRLLRQGLRQSEVARRVGVQRQSVSRWACELERAGMSGLRQAKCTGRPPKLNAVQLRDLIEYRTGVRYHEDHVWRILRQLGWSCQRPVGRALERDERAIRNWKQYRWPQLKKKRSASGAPSSSSTRAD